MKRDLSFQPSMQIAIKIITTKVANSKKRTATLAVMSDVLSSGNTNFGISLIIVESILFSKSSLLNANLVPSGHISLSAHFLQCESALELKIKPPSQGVQLLYAPPVNPLGQGVHVDLK